MNKSLSALRPCRSKAHLTCQSPRIRSTGCSPAREAWCCNGEIRRGKTGHRFSPEAGNSNNKGKSETTSPSRSCWEEDPLELLAGCGAAGASSFSIAQHPCIGQHFEHVTVAAELRALFAETTSGAKTMELTKASTTDSVAAVIAPPFFRMFLRIFIVCVTGL